MSIGLKLAVAVGFALTGVLDGAQTRTEPQRPGFHTGVDLISLSVTVTADAGQRHVADLIRNDFVVTENGVPQDLRFFAKTGSPLALALLIDTSASMEVVLTTAQEAAIGFARELRPADVAMVVDFDSKVEIAQGFTSDVEALEKAIRRTHADGATALYNAVYIALKEFGKLTPQAEPQSPRRKALIVLSDGDDTSSLIGFEDVLDVASRSDTVVYAIGLGVQDQVGRRPQSGQFVLGRLAEQTGGRAFFPQRVNDLAAVYGDIREELASQYSLAYESSSGKRDGKWRPIAVRVNRPGVTVRTRRGYFAPTN